MVVFILNHKILRLLKKEKQVLKKIHPKLIEKTNKRI